MFDYRFNGLPNMLTASMPFMPQNMLAPMPEQTQPIDPMAADSVQPAQQPMQAPQSDMNYFPPAPDANRAPITQQDYQASLSHLQPQGAPSPAPAQSGRSGGLDMGTAAAFLQGLGRGNGLLSAIGGGLGAVEECKQENQTIKYLTSQGISDAEAQVISRNPQAVVQVMQNIRKDVDPMQTLQQRKMELENPQQSLVNAGGDQIYNPQSGQWISAPNNATPEAPKIVELYDEAIGQPYKAAWNPATHTFERIGGGKAPSATQLLVEPNGEATFRQGSGLKPLTEDQSKDAVFATRAEGALGILNKHGNALSGLVDNALGGVPVVGNYFKSDGYQKAEQAGKEFLQVILRKDTETAITKEEISEYGSVYLPRPGDSAAVLQQKAVSRQRALEALKAGMPPQAILQAETTLKNTNAAYPSNGAPQSGMIEDGFRFKGGNPSDPNSWERVQ